MYVAAVAAPNSTRIKTQVVKTMHILRLWPILVVPVRPMQTSEQRALIQNRPFRKLLKCSSEYYMSTYLYFCKTWSGHKSQWQGGSTRTHAHEPDWRRFCPSLWRTLIFVRKGLIFNSTPISMSIFITDSCPCHHRLMSMSIIDLFSMSITDSCSCPSRTHVHVHYWLMPMSITDSCLCPSPTHVHIYYWLMFMSDSCSCLNRPRERSKFDISSSTLRLFDSTRVGQ